MTVDSLKLNSQAVYAKENIPVKINNNSDSASIFSNNEAGFGAEELEAQFKEVQSEQGIIGKIWGGIKNALGVGLSSNDVEKAIESYKNGEIEYEEASNLIEAYENKQKGAVNLFSNVASGVITAGVAAATGGVGAIALGAAVGGAAKAGIKTADRATNEIKGDALDAKQILKDGLTGAIDGAATVATAGMVKPLTTASIAGKSMGSTIAKGIVQGAGAGAISGAVTGAGDYAVEALVEEDVDFNVDTLLETTVQTAAFGALAGGVMGGVSNGIQYKKVYNQTMTEFRATADELAGTYREKIDSVRADYGEKFGDMHTLEEGGLTARAKSSDSIFAKLKSKFDKGELTATDFESCSKAIGDGYGVRIQLQNVPEARAKEIVMSALDGGEDSYRAFVKAVESGEELTGDYARALALLKQEQTEETLQRMIKLIESDRLVLSADEFNNYGTEFSSYFTDDQLTRLSQAYAAKTGKPLDLVNKTSFDAKTNYVTQSDSGSVTEETIDAVKFGKKSAKKADKASGYTSTQGNAQSTTTTGSPLSDTELQIRGREVNGFAEVEHIPYDIRQGKISPTDSDYSSVYGVIKGMSDESYDAYNEYLKATYKYLRAKELGITIPEPVMPAGLSYASSGVQLSGEEVQMLSKEGLTALKAAIHAAKK